MNKSIRLLPSYVAAFVLFIGLYETPVFTGFALSNLITQVLLFGALAAIPALLTQRMSYLDLAWPAGLFAIGVQVLVYGDLDHARTLLIAAVYILLGARFGMSVFAGWLQEPRGLPFELPKYLYQRIRWRKLGYKGAATPMVAEIFLRALVNATVLVTPALLMATNPKSLSSFEAVLLGAWVLCLVLEAVADRQKARSLQGSFKTGSQTAVCTTGLWKFSRHPNYFFHWAGWTALAVAALPSLFYRLMDGYATLWTLTTVSLVLVSLAMYWTVTLYTGVEATEYYSANKRPAYTDYQRVTSRFFPHRQPKPKPQVFQLERHREA
ncbi:DUF1295 domain-containing protein [Pseudonocardiaceae bacterium YIM PH 21723]|nr:DUF1295 domain-containing protein [Pseudonocardiaceae bacterium YIM PH 21723]